MSTVILVICDGLGYREDFEHNAIAQAETPNLDYYWKYYPHALLKASGEAVGLPEGQMGTSEANHLVIGSGRVIFQNLDKINKAARNGDFINNEAIKEAFAHVLEFNSALHIKGIVSDGGVHGHVDHLKALLRAAKQAGVQKICLHLFTDGRDTPPQSALGYIKDLEVFLKELGLGKIASVGGRYFGMDRDNNENRIEQHFETMTKKQSKEYASAEAIILEAYAKGVTDEFIEPARVRLNDLIPGEIQVNDAVIFANFRSDRAKQLARRFKTAQIKNLKYVTMTKYDDDLDVRVAFAPEKIKSTLSEVLSVNGLKQVRITETEKFAHLTFFFNAQKYDPDQGEERIMIPSNKDVVTHDEKPEMKAKEIAEEVKKIIKQNRHDFIAVNLVNCDMVGHTGNFNATLEAVKYVDNALKTIVKTAQEHDASVIITADHGNAEQTFDLTIGQPLTSHTLNPVPFILISPKYKTINRVDGDLSDIAPTILRMFNLPVPDEMTGQPFI